MLAIEMALKRKLLCGHCVNNYGGVIALIGQLFVLLLHHFIQMCHSDDTSLLKSVRKININDYRLKSR